MSVKVSLKSLSEGQKKTIKKLLFFQAKQDFFNKQYNNQPEPIFLYIENSYHDVIFLPYAFANILLKDNLNKKLIYPQTKFNFIGTPRQEQIPILNEALKFLSTAGSVILKCHPGFGKTVISAFLSSWTCGRTLIIYHRKILRDQWLKTYQTYTTAKVWIHKKNEAIPQDTQVILSMDKIVNYLDIDDITSIKTLIIDEAHSFCAPSRIIALLTVQPRYIIACSATLDSRDDGLQSIIYTLCGRNVVTKKASKDFTVYKINTGIEVEIQQNFRGQMDYGKMLNDLAVHELRTQNIIDIILENLDHKIMVLCARKIGVEILYDKLKELELDVDTLFGMKNSYQNSNILLGTFSKIGTGFDEATSCKNFDGRKSDMLIICSSVKNVGNLEQYVGRVFRVDNPVVYHLVDSLSTSQNHWKLCQTWYKRTGAKIHSININPELHEVYEPPKVEIVDIKNKSSVLQKLESIKGPITTYKDC